MKKIISLLLISVVLFSCAENKKFSTSSEAVSQSQIKVASYNMLRLGTNNHKDYDTLSKVVSNFDVIASIEVIKEEGLKNIVDKLGSDWHYIISEKNVGESSYKEYFGFIYNDKIESVTSLGFYPVENEFARPPFGVQFKVKNSDFTFNLIVSHIVFGKSEKDRINEINNLGKVYQYFEDKTGNKKITIICGDFNLENIKEFNELIDMNCEEIIPIKKSTLGENGPVSDYDHMFISNSLKDRVIESDVFYWTSDWQGTRKTVSDHFPIYTTFKY